MTHETAITLADVGFRYPSGTQAIHRLSLAVKSGQLVACVGASGSGKTTLLRLIAGLEAPTEGSVKVFGRQVSDLSPRDRSVGFISQSGSIYPNASVIDNVIAPMRGRGVQSSGIEAKAMEILARVGISAMATRRATTLSGGERQKLAVAKLLGWSPRVLCLDEPLASVDAASRPDFVRLFKTLQDELRPASVYVTHSAPEALALGTSVLVLSRGRALQCDSPEVVFQHPAHMDVLQVLSEQPVAFLKTDIVRVDGEAAVFRLGRVELQVTAVVGERLRATTGLLAVLPRHTVLVSAERPGSVKAHILTSEFRGTSYWLHCDSEIGRVCLQAGQSASPGTVVSFGFLDIPMSVFDTQTGTRLGEITAARVSTQY